MQFHTWNYIVNTVSYISTHGNVCSHTVLSMESYGAHANLHKIIMIQKLQSNGKRHRVT